jgi:hypothetical protein
VLTGCVGGGLYQPRHCVHDPEHVLRVDDQQGGLPVSFEVVERVRAAPAVEPQVAVAEFLPGRVQIHGPVSPPGSDDHRHDLAKELGCRVADLSGHLRTSVKKSVPVR